MPIDWTSGEVNPDPVDYRDIDMSKAYVLYNPADGQAYVVEIDYDFNNDGNVEGPVPQFIESMIELGFQPMSLADYQNIKNGIQPQVDPFNPTVPESLRPATPDIPGIPTREQQESVVDTISPDGKSARDQAYEDAAVAAAQAAIDRQREYEAQQLAINSNYLNSALANTQEAAALDQRTRDLTQARTENPARFADALKFNGQELWRQRQRVTDKQIADSAAALALQNSVLSTQRQLDLAAANYDYTLAGLSAAEQKIIRDKAYNDAMRESEKARLPDILAVDSTSNDG